jgi:type I restriction enzyme S subunit
LKNKYKFSEFCEVSSSKRILKSEYVDDGIPFYRSKEIIEIASGKSIREPLYISFDRYNFLTEKFGAPQNGDILITSVGTLGVTLLVDLDYKFYFKDGNLTWLKNINSNIIDKNYLIHWLKSSFFFNQIDNNNIGAVQKALTISFLNTLEISLPSLSLQKQIAKVLSDLDSKIEINNKINQELEAMAKTLYDYWFVQFDFPDKNGKPYKSSGGKMVFNEELKREIPVGWEVKELSEISDIKAGGDKPKNYTKEKTKLNTIPIYSNGITNDGLYGYTDVAKIQKESITVSARGTIGFCVLRKKPFVPIIRLISISPKISGEVKFLFESLKNLVFENSGSVQQQLTVPQVAQLKVTYPPKELLEKHQILSTSALNIIETNKEQNQKLSELRDWLLPMLMNGQVSVGYAAQ